MISHFLISILVFHLSFNSSLVPRKTSPLSVDPYNVQQNRKLFWDIHKRRINAAQAHKGKNKVDPPRLLEYPGYSLQRTMVDPEFHIKHADLFHGDMTREKMLAMAKVDPKYNGSLRDIREKVNVGLSSVMRRYHPGFTSYNYDEHEMPTIHEQLRLYKKVMEAHKFFEKELERERELSRPPSTNKNIASRLYELFR